MLFCRLSLDEAAGFSRDAFGRQSMSEKRHATLDAKNTDTYQRNKKLREEREQQRREHQGSMLNYLYRHTILIFFFGNQVYIVNFKGVERK